MSVADFEPIDSPVGGLLAVVDEDGRLCELGFTRGRHARLLHAASRSDQTQATIERTRTQIAEYFAGTRTTFELPLAPRGSAFEQAVWNALVEIPYGQTATYGDIAARVGMPQGAQAVGRANGANPIPIVIPCHRVIGSDGKLVGYAGGMDVKEALLRLERVLL